MNKRCQACVYLSYGKLVIVCVCQNMDLTANVCAQSRPFLFVHIVCLLHALVTNLVLCQLFFTNCLFLFETFHFFFPLKIGSLISKVQHNASD